MKCFNTAGPCNPELHYMLPTAPRLPRAMEYIGQGHYFVVHAPRQTGKTTTLMALASELNESGRYAALTFSCERAKIAGDDYERAGHELLSAIRDAAEVSLPEEFRPPSPWPDSTPGSLIHAGLSAWARHCRLPLVLLFDEIDSLRGDSLISVLAQLRSGFPSRPSWFPASIVLCGMRDVRDYKAASGGDPSRLGSSSPFNVKVASLRIADFTDIEVAQLYRQHAAEGGREFSPLAIHTAFGYSQGQPWLVNALARESLHVTRMPPEVPITAIHMDEAKEQLILARATHLDSLTARLAEPRVRRVIEPLIAGTLPRTDLEYNDDLSYLRDLGLIGRDNPVSVANPIYREVIVRVLGAATESVVTASPAQFLLPDGRLDFAAVLAEFAEFWQANAEILVSGQVYHEAAPQLVFMAFLQRIVNGGGLIDREYGVGRGRLDLLVRKGYTGPDGHPTMQKEAVELKVWHPRQVDPLDIGLVQLDQYLSRLMLDHGTLVIFDRRPEALDGEPLVEISATVSPSGRPVTLMRA